MGRAIRNHIFRSLASFWSIRKRRGPANRIIVAMGAKSQNHKAEVVRWTEFSMRVTAHSR
jgi:hypothetical protein